MTLNEAARLLGVTPDNLRRQIHLGKLRAAKHGRDWWVEDNEVERYRKENRRSDVCGACGRPRGWHSDKPLSPMHDWHRYKANRDSNRA